MKTKIMITTVLLLLFSVTSFAQTKEETIAWIKEKLEKHGGETDKGERVEIINITPCNITYKLTYPHGNSSIIEFNPSSSIWDGKTSRSGQIIKKYYNFEATNRGTKTIYISGLNIYSNGVPDIDQRIGKALNHLATFCPKKQETF